jgi:hypothetical protein
MCTYCQPLFVSKILNKYRVAYINEENDIKVVKELSIQ